MVMFQLIGLGEITGLATIGQEVWAQPSIRIDIPVTLRQANRKNRMRTGGV